jgi:hypothetical protein
MKIEFFQKLKTSPMKNMLLYFRLLLIPLFLLTGCDDGDDEPQPANRKEILSLKPWKIKKVQASGINITNRPEVSEFKDAQIKFEQDGTYTLTNETETRTGTWAFANNETELVLDPNTADEFTMDIVSLRDNSAKFRATREVEPFGSLVFTLELEYVENTYS